MYFIVKNRYNKMASEHPLLEEEKKSRNYYIINL